MKNAPGFTTVEKAIVSLKSMIYVGSDDYAYEQERNWKAKTHEEGRI